MGGSHTWARKSEKRLRGKKRKKRQVREGRALNIGRNDIAEVAIRVPSSKLVGKKSGGASRFQDNPRCRTKLGRVNGINWKHSPINDVQ